MELNKLCPCKDCEDRYPKCHSSCDGYISWRKQLDDRNDIIREGKEKTRSLYAGKKKK